jgi:hypothetical protein
MWGSAATGIISCALEFVAHGANFREAFLERQATILHHGHHSIEDHPITFVAGVVGHAHGVLEMLVFAKPFGSWLCRCGKPGGSTNLLDETHHNGARAAVLYSVSSSVRQALNSGSRAATGARCPRSQADRRIAASWSIVMQLAHTSVSP